MGVSGYLRSGERYSSLRCENLAHIHSEIRGATEALLLIRSDLGVECAMLQPLESCRASQFRDV